MSEWTSEMQQRAEELCKKATPGPWVCDEFDFWFAFGESRGTDQYGTSRSWDSLPEEDYDFISESRTFLPAALARIRELEAELTYIREHTHCLCFTQEVNHWHDCPCPKGEGRVTP